MSDEKLNSAGLILQIIEHIRKNKANIMEHEKLQPTELLAMMRKSNWKQDEKQTFPGRVCRVFVCRIRDFHAYVDSDKTDTKVLTIWYEDEPLNL